MLILLNWLVQSGQLRAQGTIRYVDPSDQQIYGSLGPKSVYFDLNGDGVDDVRLRATGSQFDVVPTGNNAVLAIRQPPPDLGSFVVHLNLGLEIGSSLQPAWSWQRKQTLDPRFDDLGSTILYCDSNGCLGYWSPNGDTAYVGVRFYQGTQLHYAWIRVRTFAVGGTVFDWAYNTTPDQAILAGAVPEPSTWVLVIVAALTMLACSRCKSSHQRFRERFSRSHKGGLHCQR